MTVIFSDTVPALTVGIYTLTVRSSLRLTPDRGENTLVQITRDGLPVFATVLTTEQIYGPFLAGDVLTITAQRGDCTYQVIYSPANVESDNDVKIAASRLGFSTSSTDNSPAFTELANQVLFAADEFGPVTERVVIELPSGVFLVDGAKMDLTYRGNGGLTPRFTLKGAGKGVTIIRSTATSTAAAVLELQAGFCATVLIEDLTIEARADIEQDGLHVFASRRTFDNTGGVTELTMNRIGINSSQGDAAVFVGGDDFSGPMQFFVIEACQFNSASRVSLHTFGQFGQVNVINGDTSNGSLVASSGPCMAFTQDNRRTLAPTAVDTTNNFFTENNFEVPTGTAVRIIGADLPSGLSTGVTYYVRRYEMGGSGSSNRMTLHSSRPNVASDTRVALGSTGTLGNWYVSPLFLTSVTADTLNFSLPHHLIDGSEVLIVGTSLPTGLAVATSYYVIRESARSIKLATTKLNAFAGIPITFSGGNVTLFGLSRPPAAALNNPYSVRLDNVTAQTSICSLYLSGASDVKANLHIENVKNSVYAYNSQLAIDGGTFANSGEDGGRGVVVYVAGSNSRVTVMGAPVLTGVRDKVVTVASGSFYADTAGGFVQIDASTTAQQSSGILQQLGASPTLDIGSSDFVFVNTSATPITSISSKFGPRASVKIMAFGGPLTFGTGGNLSLYGNANVTIPERAVAEFEMIDTLATWAMIGNPA